MYDNRRQIFVRLGEMGCVHFGEFVSGGLNALGMFAPFHSCCGAWAAALFRG